jgi:hypothetical protein
MRRKSSLNKRSVVASCPILEELEAFSRDLAATLPGSEEAPMADVDHPKEHRGMRADGSGPLPQFIDPDKTLERLPALDYDSSPSLYPSAGLDCAGLAAYAPVQVTDTDLTATVEVPPDPTDDLAATVEIPPKPGDDLAITVEVRPKQKTASIADSDLSGAAAPSLPYPQRPSATFDLDSLLALARIEAQKSPVYFPRPSPVPPQAWSSSTSDEDPEASDPTAELPDRHPRRRTPWFVGAAIVAVTTVGIAVVHASVPAYSTTTARSAPPVTQPAADPAPPPAVQAQPQSTNIPSVSVQSLPRVKVGTISLAAAASSHRLFVDGRVVTSGSAVVKCGVHLVQVGSRGVKRYVSVPCGEEVVVAN